MPLFLTPAEVLNFTMFFTGLISAWAVIKGFSND